MKRNRIVIDFDNQASAGARARSSRRRGIVGVLAVVAIILVLIVGGLTVGGFFWWRHYQNGPAYALALLVDAIQRNDKQTIDGVLDTDTIATDFIAQIRARAPVSSLPVGQIDAAKIMSPKVKDTLHDQLIKQVQQMTDAAAGKPFIIIALAVPHFADIKQENQTARASVNLKDEQIDLTMALIGDHWRITTVRDDKLATLIAQSMLSNLPANGTHIQDELQRQLNRLPKRNR